MRKKIALAVLVIILILVNWSIAGKEKQLHEGKVVYLKLRPVDPRSLMQGDYMALRFRLADQVYKALYKTESRRYGNYKTPAKDGYVIITLDHQNIGTFKSLYENQPLAKDEILLQYRVRHGIVKFATNAYFFQEGHRKDYQSAKYGQFRVNDKGELLLAAMYDENLNKLENKNEN